MSARTAGRQDGTRWLAVAATVVVVVVMAVNAGLGTPSVEPSFSVSSQPTAPIQTRPPTPTDAPITAADLPVISVEEAIAIRDLADRSDELTVEGWFNPDRLRFSITALCVWPYPDSRAVRLLVSYCGSLRLYATEEAALAEEGESIAWQSIGLSPSPISWPVPEGSVVRVVLIGHFDDRRAALCGQGAVEPQTTEQRDALAQVEQICRDQFVVDQIARIGDEVPSQASIGETVTVWDREQAIEALADYVPPESILHTNTVAGEHVEVFEPGLVGGLETLTSRRALWMFRVLVDTQPASVRTWLLVDGIGSAFRSVGTTFERVDRWVEPTGSPYASVDLDDGPGIGALAEIWDRSGTLIWRRAATAADPEIFGNIEGVRVTTLPGQPNHVRLTWWGGVCENYQVVVEARATIIRILAIPRDTAELLCPAAATKRDLILQFGQPMGEVEAELVASP